MGPFPVHMEGVIEKMEKKEMLSVKSIQEYDGYNPTEIYKALKRSDVSMFTKEEKKR